MGKANTVSSEVDTFAEPAQSPGKPGPELVSGSAMPAHVRSVAMPAHVHSVAMSAHVQYACFDFAARAQSQDA